MVMCAVIGCSNRSDRKKCRGTSFYRIPSVITHQGEQTQELSEKRRKAWFSQVKRADLDPNLKKGLYVCNIHFITGKPAALYDRSNPDWEPTLNMGYNDQTLKSPSVIKRYELYLRRKRSRQPIEKTVKRKVLAVVDSSPKRSTEQVHLPSEAIVVVPEVSNLSQSQCAVDNVTTRLKKFEVDIRATSTEEPDWSVASSMLGMFPRVQDVSKTVKTLRVALPNGCLPGKISITSGKNMAMPNPDMLIGMLNLPPNVMYKYNSKTTVVGGSSTAASNITSHHPESSILPDFTPLITSESIEERTSCIADPSQICRVDQERM